MADEPIDWQAALDSFYGVNGWDENGWRKDGPTGRDPYAGMAMNRAQRHTGDARNAASAGLPTLGKRR